jgi:hypothetical protein
MKQIVSVRANGYYQQKESEKDFTLIPMVELVIIYTDGKNYTVEDDLLISDNKYSESRMIVSGDMLQTLITDLQLQQKIMNGLKQNAEKLNSLVKYIQEDTDKPVE